MSSGSNSVSGQQGEDGPDQSFDFGTVRLLSSQSMEKALTSKSLEAIFAKTLIMNEQVGGAPINWMDPELEILPEAYIKGEKTEDTPLGHVDFTQEGNLGGLSGSSASFASVNSASGGPRPLMRMPTITDYDTEGHGTCTEGEDESVPGTPVQSRQDSHEGEEQNVCGNCKTKETSMWRKSMHGGVLCNACGLYERLYKLPRPQHLCERKRRRRTNKDHKHTGPKPLAPAPYRMSPRVSPHVLSPYQSPAGTPKGPLSPQAPRHGTIGQSPLHGHAMAQAFIFPDGPQGHPHHMLPHGPGRGPMHSDSMPVQIKPEPGMASGVLATGSLVNMPGHYGTMTHMGPMGPIDAFSSSSLGPGGPMGGMNPTSPLAAGSLGNPPSGGSNHGLSPAGSSIGMLGGNPNLLNPDPRAAIGSMSGPMGPGMMNPQSLPHTFQPPMSPSMNHGLVNPTSMPPPAMAPHMVPQGGLPNPNSYSTHMEPPGQLGGMAGVMGGQPSRRMMVGGGPLDFSMGGAGLGGLPPHPPPPQALQMQQQQAQILNPGPLGDISMGELNNLIASATKNVDLSRGAQDILAGMDDQITTLAMVGQGDGSNGQMNMAMNMNMNMNMVGDMSGGSNQGQGDASGLSSMSISQLIF